MSQESLTGVLGIVLFVVGIMLGYFLGDFVAPKCSSKREYWIANGVVLFLGLIASTWAQIAELIALQAFLVGVMGGAICGLKLGFEPPNS